MFTSSAIPSAALVLAALADASIDEFSGLEPDGVFLNEIGLSPVEDYMRKRPSDGHRQLQTQWTIDVIFLFCLKVGQRKHVNA